MCFNRILCRAAWVIGSLAVVPTPVFASTAITTGDDVESAPSIKTFIVSAVRDGLDRTDMNIIANGLKGLGYQQVVSDIDTTSSEMKRYLGREVMTYYHTGHGSVGAVMTSDGSISCNGVTVMPKHTFFATCLTLANDNWKSSFGRTAKNIMGYTKVSFDAPVDDNVAKRLIEELQKGNRYIYAWYLANVGIPSVSDRWCIYHRGDGRIIEYSARKGNIPPRALGVRWEPLGDSGRMWIKSGLLEDALHAYRSKFEFQWEPADIFTYVAPGEGLQLQPMNMSKGEAMELAMQWLSDRNMLPQDLVLDKIVELGYRTGPNEEQDLAGYVIHFKRMLNGISVRSNSVQDHLSVMVGSEGVISVSMYWPKVVASKARLEDVRKPVLTPRQAVEVAMPKIVKMLKSTDVELYFEDIRPVWGSSGRYGKDRRLIPAYELVSNDGASFIINAHSGDLVFDMTGSK